MVSLAAFSRQRALLASPAIELAGRFLMISCNRPTHARSGNGALRLPSRVVDPSSPLDNETVYDPPFMRPKIEYRSNADTAPLLCELFPGLQRADLPEGEGWAIEQIQLTTHNGTHMDAPIHFQSHSIDGKPM